MYKQYVYTIVVSILIPMRAQSLQDIQSMQFEYNRVQKQNIEQDNVSLEQVPLSGTSQKAQIIPYKFLVEDEIDIKLKNFGYDFFTRRDTVAFWENLPTPSNYLLGPGDQLVISLWGETQLRQTYSISRDGKIYDPKVGLLNLTGKSIEEARSYLKEQYGRVYATLKGKAPTTFIDVSLGELRSINVNFVGEVKYPGVFPIHPFSTVITGLIQAGGVDTTGSLRHIQIKRNGVLESTIDLYNYFINGELATNIQLRDQDIIVIPPRTSFVTIDSAVINPGIYESITGETVYDLIQYAGGKTHNASDNVGIRRMKSKSVRKNGNMYEAIYVNFDSTKVIPVSSGDDISVNYLFNELQQVEIIGQVKMPGIYHYYEQMTFKNLISLGGGLDDPTFWKSVYHDQAEIIRRDPNSRYEKVIKVNLNNIYNGEISKDIQLQNLDRVVIHANLNYFEKENIHISGEVNIPGSYPLIVDNETLQSILKRAGDLTPKALKNGISIYRNNKYFEVNITQNTDNNVVDNKTKGPKVRVAWQNESIILMPGDSVVVKESTGTVKVSGQVYNPGLIEYRKGKSLRHYINKAGGITDSGNKKNIIVIYANGLVSPKEWYVAPKIEDGATIVVNEKELKEPFNMTQFASNTASLISSLVTIMVLSQQINQ